AHHLLDLLHENLAIADLAGARRLDDGLDYMLDHLFVDHDLHLHFRQEIDHIFGAAIQFGMPFLTSETLHFSHGQAGDADFSQRFTHFIQLEWFDNVGYLLHMHSSTIRGAHSMSIA